MVLGGGRAAWAGPPLPPFDVAPAPPIDLGPVRVGTASPPRTITLTANTPSTITGVTIGGVFEIVTPPAPSYPHTVAPGAVLTMQVALRPTIEEPVATQVVIALQGGGTFPIPLEGEGVVPRPVGPDALGLGTLCTSFARTRPLVIDNVDGTGALAITAATSSNPAFTVAPRAPATYPVTVPAGDAAALDVTIAGAAAGREEAGTITVETDVPGRTFTVDVTAAGGLPDGFGADVAALDFGSIEVGVAAPSRRVTFRNCAAGDHTVDDIALGGTDDVDFLLGTTPDLPYALRAGDAIEVPIGFTPSRAGVEMATLTFAHDGPGAPTAIALAGTGVVTPGPDGGDPDGDDDGGCCGTSRGPAGAMVPLALVALGLPLARRRARR